MFREFLCPTTVAEAIHLRTERASAIYLAGGTDINSFLWPCRPKIEPDCAVSLAKLPLHEVSVSPASLRIGSLVTMQDLVERTDLPPMLSAALALFANRNIRSMATLGGNIGGNQACSNVLPALLALDARLVVADGSGEKTIELAHYLEKHDPQLLITAVEIPQGWQTRRWGVRKHSRTVNDISIVAVGVSFEGGADNVRNPIIAVNGVTSRAMRLSPLERELEGKPLPPREDIDKRVKLLLNSTTDLRGSAEFKCHLAAVLVSDTLHEAAQREVV